MLRQKLQADQLTALKSGDKEKLEVLRFVLARVKNQEIEKKSELTDEETVTILKKIDRELHESLEAAQKGQREDLIANSNKQIALLSEYIPAELSDEELEKKVREIVDANKDTAASNPKMLIGKSMGQLKNLADSRRIMATLKKLVPELS